ncbi:hypothetical protein [Mesorhizobium sp. WSM4904]|uniref:hypothetical protein n=1 Tax=Mesorhizobium sp. WSM4904 TaxID=3038545 RepID=UPI0024183448|nr:hypothetical protein [Mesorhizobium sp. WSM4904]WFP62425.1 hypothetical protein QAZ47_28925 [Mesorhizobium sp. WSM4904]
MAAAGQASSKLSNMEAEAVVGSQIDHMLQWYWDETDKWERWAWRLQTSILVLSFLVTVIAALPPPSHPDYVPWMKWLVVVISAATTLVSGFLIKSGIERTAQLREQGRIRLSALKQKTILELTQKAMNEEERLTCLRRLVDVMEDVEQRFGVHPVVAGGSGKRRSGGI